MLTAVKEEESYEITDTALDDFVMFRYELNSIYKKNYFTGGHNDNSQDNFYGGLQPLSIIGGRFIRDAT